MKNKETEHHLGNGDFINIKASKIVKLQEQFYIGTEKGLVTFYGEVSVDFADIDEKLHETAFNMLSSKFKNKVSFGDNPFSQCQPAPKRKWYQFWKPKNLYI